MQNNKILHNCQILDNLNSNSVAIFSPHNAMQTIVSESLPLVTRFEPSNTLRFICMVADILEN